MDEMKIACALVSTLMIILHSIELSSQTSWNRNEASVPLLKGMQRSSSPDDGSTRSRGYVPPQPQLVDLVPTGPRYKLKIIYFAKFATRIESTSDKFPPTSLYERLFKFSEEHVLKCEVPNASDASPPHFEPINNQGKVYPVAANVNGDIIGIYIAAPNKILRIYDSDAKIQVTVNIYTDKVKPYSKVFGYLSS